MELIALLDLFCSSCLLKIDFCGQEFGRYGVLVEVNTAYQGFLGAQIHRIFLDGYGVLDVRTIFFIFLRLSSRMRRRSTEDDTEVDIEEDENEPELTYPYKEVDPLNTPPPVSESKPEDVIEVENPIEHGDKTIPASIHKVGESSNAPLLREDNDGLLPGLMKRDINSLFGRMASLSRRLCVLSSVEQGTAVMENMVEKLGNAKDKVECKKLKKELDVCFLQALNL
ncbi:hypothetical protein Tco_0772703 [Tanacetum coccineum]|uniref:Uncharacterized protein n=1 Tax=Tanacetum coccineum TaxID=301880 RepID=A0ABQ4ZLJ9_9ASTR